MPDIRIRTRIIAVVCAVLATCAVARAQSLDTAFNPGANVPVTAIAVQADGKILVGGVFTTLGGGGTGTTTRYYIGRLNADGSLDTSFNPGANGRVQALAVQADGKILVGGEFTTLGGGGTGTTPRNKIGRLNADGSLDTSFDPGANDYVYALAVQADGKILVSGWFTTLGGGGTGTTTRYYIGRLNADGSLDTSFNPGANSYARAFAVRADGKIVVGGGFTTLGGGGTGTTPRNRIGRLNADGSLDTSFDPGANDWVYALAVQADGKIVVGGFFTTLDGGGTGTTTRNFLGRLNADGSLDTSFNPGANSFVWVLAVQTDGKILVSGNFTMLGGGGTGTTTRNFLGRLNADGSLDTSFDPGANGPVLALVVQADGQIVVGGDFTTLGGGGTGTTTRNYLGRLLVDGANPTPAVTTHPSSQTVTAGATASFSAAASGSPAPTVQWQVSTDSGSTWSDISGATSTTYSFTAALEDSGKQYRAVFTNSAGSATTNAATLTVNTSTSSTIASTFDSDAESWSAGSFPDYGPYDQVIGATTPTWGSAVGNPGGAIYMADPGTGNFFFGAPAAYLGAKSNYYGGQLTYDLKSVSTGDLFSDADVILLGGGLVLVYESHTTVSSGWTTFTIPLSEAGWKVGTPTGVAATKAQFQSALANITALRIRGEFRWYAETGYLDNVSLSSSVAPSVTTHPSNQAVTGGATASFSAAASGSPSPTVQWQVSTDSGSTWTDISGATSTTYSFTAALGDSGNQYRAVFTNSVSSVPTNAATLTVNTSTSPTIANTFDSDAQSWSAGSFPDGGPYDQVTGATTPTWGSAVGNPGGAIYIVDPASFSNFFFGAPAGYLGDKSSYYGGQLRYDVKSTGSGSLADEVDVILLGGGLVLVYDSPTTASSGWTTFTIPLSEAGWKVDTPTGVAATKAQFQSALANITALRIRGEFRVGTDTGYLDNVSLSSVPGDLNGDTMVNLTDAILALQIVSAITPTAIIYKEADVNGDGKIGLEEAIYVLQDLSGLRSAVTNVSLINDNFDTLNTANWWLTRGSNNDHFGEGKPFDASGVTIANGIATLNADITDQVGVMYSKPLAVTKGDILTIKRRTYVHPANREYAGTLSVYEVADPGLSASKTNTFAPLFGLMYYNFDYGTDLNLFSLVWGGNLPHGPGDFSGGTAPQIAPLWDQWFEEEFIYNSGTGDTVYKINGVEKMRVQASPLSQPYIKIMMHSYGWFTGHYIQMDYIAVETAKP